MRSSTPKFVGLATVLLLSCAPAAFAQAKVNTVNKCQPGKPPAATHKAESVGHSSSSQPAGRSQRINCKYRASLPGGGSKGCGLDMRC